MRGQLRAGASAVWSARSGRIVRSMIERNGIEIVHVHNLFPLLSPAVLRSARAAGARVVVTLHNFRLMCLPANLLRDGRICEACVGHVPWRGVAHRCYRDSALASAAVASSLTVHRALRTFDAVERYLAVSEFVRRKHVEGGIQPDRIRVKANFAWPSEPRLGAGEYFLFLGRLASEKGVDTLLRAWEIDRPKFPLLVVGDGPEAASLRRSAPPGVEFRGQVSSDAVGAILAGARALMVPSRWYEAAPRSIIEAYAAGVPVMASDIGALPEAVVEGTSGSLVDTEDPTAWVECVRQLDDAESERLGAGALSLWRERYGPRSGLEGLESAYREALGART
jgi:glycosyltransferase involved in cell wall biosynthesis